MASNYYSTTSYGVEIYQTTTPVYLRPAPYIFGGTWVYNVGGVGNSNLTTSCLFDGTRLYLNNSNTDGAARAWFESVQYKSAGSLIVTNAVGDFIRIQYSSLDLSGTVYIANGVTVLVQGSWWWFDAGGNTGVQVRVAYSDYIDTNIGIGSTIVYELNSVPAAAIYATDTQFITIRDYAGQLGKDPNGYPSTNSNYAPLKLIVSTIGEQSRFTFTEDYKAGVFSAKSISTFQIANTYGTPLFEGKPRILELNVASLTTNNITGETSTILDNARVNDIITYNTSYLRQLYTGDFSTISTIANGNYRMICAFPYYNSNYLIERYSSVLIARAPDGVILSNISVSGDITVIDTPLFRGSTIFNSGTIGSFNELSTYQSVINYRNFVVNGAIEVHGGIPAVIADGPTYVEQIQQDNLAGVVDLAGGLNSYSLLANQCTVIGARTYVDQLNMGATTLETVAATLDISAVCLIAPSVSTGTVSTTSMECSTLVAGAHIIYSGAELTLPDIPVSNASGSLAISSVVTTTVESMLTSADTVDAVSTTTAAAGVGALYVPVLNGIHMSSFNIATDIAIASVAEFNTANVSNAVVSTFNTNQLFSNPLRLFIPSQEFELYATNSSNVFTNTISCSSMSVQDISSAVNVVFSGAVTTSSMTSQHIYTSSAMTEVGILPNAITMGEIPATTLYPGQYVYQSGGAVPPPPPIFPIPPPYPYTSGESSPRLPFINSNIVEYFEDGSGIEQCIFNLFSSTPCQCFYKFEQIVPYYPAEIAHAWYGVLKDAPGLGIDVTTTLINYFNTVPNILINDSTMGYSGPPLFGEYRLWIDFYPANESPSLGVKAVYMNKNEILDFASLGSSIVYVTINQTTNFTIDLQNPAQTEGSFIPIGTSNIMTFNSPFIGAPLKEPSGISAVRKVAVLGPLKATFYLMEPTVNYLDLADQIVMNNNVMKWPYSLSTTTIDNKYNSMDIRNIFYLGSINSASDAKLKEDICDADLTMCRATFDEIGLKRFKWIDSYIEAYSPADTHVLGILATDVAKVLPNAVQTRDDGISMVDSEQLEMAHIGVTKSLQKRLERLERICNPN
jgi:hypothetical protein